MGQRKQAIILLAALIMCSGKLYPAESKTDILESYVGHDLRKMDKIELMPLLTLIGKKPEEVDNISSLWHVWKIERSDKVGYVVLEGEHITLIPSCSHATIHLLDDSGKKLNKWLFSTGWRIDIRDAACIYSEELQAYIIVIQTSPAINGADIAKQYYSFSDDYLRLIRIEDSEGMLVRNNYEYPNHAIGPEVKGVTAQEWLGLLKSKNHISILAAFTFIGGNHINVPPERQPAHIVIEDVSQAKMVLELRQNSEVRRLIQKYRKSSKKWLKEAAQM